MVYEEHGNERELKVMKTEMALPLAIGLLTLLLLGLKGVSVAEVITFEPYTEEEEPYLIDGGTHNFDRMVADFGAGFTNNHFRFADMAVFWIYKFEFDGPVMATATMDLGAEFKVSIATSRSGEEPDYIVVLEEEDHVHALENKEVRTIESREYFKNPGNTLWIKFEDAIPQDGWGPYLDSFTLEYTVGYSVEPIAKLSVTWGRIRTGS